MENIKYTTVDRIISKIIRDLKTDFNESDIIEWAGEATEFLQVYQIKQQFVSLIKVEKYSCPVPTGLDMVLQLMKYNGTYCSPQKDCSSQTIEVNTPNPQIEDSCCTEFESIINCPDKLLLPENNSYRTCYDMQWQYIDWRHSNYCTNFEPIRLSNNTYFGNFVCQELQETPYKSNTHEYTISGTTDKYFEFSFENGYVALAYIGSAFDKSTGYPLIPDNVSYMSAIGYYIKWKLAERYVWSGKFDYNRLAQESERLWLKYAKQAKNYMKMPKTNDQLQNILEQSFKLIPNHRSYYNNYSDVGRA